MEKALRFAIMGLLVSGFASPGFGQSSVGAKAYMVVDQGSGHILFTGNANQKVPVASLTKIATAMVVLDWAEVHKQDLAAYTQVPQSALTVGGTNSLGLSPGDHVSLRDLIYAALLQSDNVAAHTLANHVGAH